MAEGPVEADLRESADGPVADEACACGVLYRVVEVRVEKLPRLDAVGTKVGPAEGLVDEDDCASVELVRVAVVPVRLRDKKPAPLCRRPLPPLPRTIR